MNIIMAAGNQVRWTFDERVPIHKQLVPVGNRTLIEDTQDKTEGGVVVTHVPEIQRRVSRFFIPAIHDTLSHSIYSSLSLFDGKLAVFLGDTYYTRKLCLEIAANDWPISFWGRVFGEDSELFAMCGMDKSLIEKCCMASIRHKTHRGGYGMMWDIYRSASGLPWKSIEQTRLFHPVTDPRVKDFDRPDQYLEWRKMMKL